jgi:ribulose-5-phosphate 4-epimerase/fuculose-1-phosphate aldolase
MNEGVIKFSAQLTDADLPHCDALPYLTEVRTELHDLGLIGVLPDGVGYGNVSVRLIGSEQFIISGSATGASRTLPDENYCRIDSLNLAKNKVYCTGRVPASSESMSHGAVYQASGEIGCVLHVHSRELFDFMLAKNLPQTSETTAYGTPKMAKEIMSLVRAGGVTHGAFVMAGHEDGVIAYGVDVDSARQALFDIHGQCN